MSLAPPLQEIARKFQKIKKNKLKYLIKNKLKDLIKK